MFEAWSHWTWVSIAWAEVVLAYVGYLVYLGWRRRQVLREHGARQLAADPVAARDRASGGRS